MWSKLASTPERKMGHRRHLRKSDIKVMKNWAVETVAHKAQASMLRSTITTRPPDVGTRAHEYLSGQRDMAEIADDPGL